VHALTCSNLLQHNFSRGLRSEGSSTRLHFILARKAQRAAEGGGGIDDIPVRVPGK
jgi:hypothetical protein